MYLVRNRSPCTLDFSTACCWLRVAQPPDEIPPAVLHKQQDWMLALWTKCRLRERHLCMAALIKGTLYWLHNTGLTSENVGLV